MPSMPAIRPTRSWLKFSMIERKPLSSTPIRCDAGTRQSPEEERRGIRRPPAHLAVDRGPLDQGVAIHKEEGDAAEAGARRSVLQSQSSLLSCRRGDERLRPVEDVRVAIQPCGRGHGCDVAAASRFGDAEA